MKKSYGIYALMAGLAILAASGYFIGDYFVDFALKRGNADDPLAPPAACASIMDPKLVPPAMPEAEHEEWEIMSADGLALRGTHFVPPEQKKETAHLWAVLVHGYGRNQDFARDYAEEYLKRGYQVLTPDLRAAGRSEGTYITMGAKESEELVLWAEKILEADPEAKISLHGVSMGAATVMMASALEVPHLYAVIEDCGYTSAYEMFSQQVEKLFGLPSFPIMDCVDVVARFRTGVAVSDMAPLKKVASAKVPILFIHGDKDGLVPYSMMSQLYDAANAPGKERMTIPGAAHAAAKNTMPRAYFGQVFDFLDKQAYRVEQEPQE